MQVDSNPSPARCVASELTPHEYHRLQKTFADAAPYLEEHARHRLMASLVIESVSHYKSGLMLARPFPGFAYEVPIGWYHSVNGRVTFIIPDEGAPDMIIALTGWCLFDHRTYCYDNSGFRLGSRTLSTRADRAIRRHVELHHPDLVLLANELENDLDAFQFFGEISLWRTWQ